ncbi:hypothetical protein FRX31_013533, partial [Thalictrum thalictroides]
TYRKDGKLAIAFSKDDIEKGQTYISAKSVVLKFSAERPHLNLIRNTIHKDWNIEGNFTLGLLDPKHVLLSFESEAEIKKALSRYNCQVMGIRFKNFRKKFPGKLTSYQNGKQATTTNLQKGILKLPQGNPLANSSEVYLATGRRFDQPPSMVFEMGEHNQDSVEDFDEESPGKTN